MRKTTFLLISITLILTGFYHSVFSPPHAFAAEGCALTTLSVTAENANGEAIAPTGEGGNFPLGTRFVFSGSFTGDDCDAGNPGFPSETALRLISPSSDGGVSENFALFSGIPTPQADGDYNFTYEIQGNRAGERSYCIIFNTDPFNISCLIPTDQQSLAPGISVKDVNGTDLITFSIAPASDDPDTDGTSGNEYACGERITGLSLDEEPITCADDPDPMKRCCPTSCGGAQQLRTDGLPPDAEPPPDDGDGNSLYYWVCGYDGAFVITQPPTPTPPLQPCQTASGKTPENCNTALGIISSDPGEFVGNLLGILLSISGMIALYLIVRSGYQLMMSRGNPEAIQEARERLISAIVGLLLIIFSLIIMSVIGVDLLKIPGFGA